MPFWKPLAHRPQEKEQDQKACNKTLLGLAEELRNALLQLVENDAGPCIPTSLFCSRCYGVSLKTVPQPTGEPLKVQAGLLEFRSPPLKAAP